mgnify:CR=1 FL=1
MVIHAFVSFSCGIWLVLGSRESVLRMLVVRLGMQLNLRIQMVLVVSLRFDAL